MSDMSDKRAIIFIHGLITGMYVMYLLVTIYGR